jgi:hypothetical protein
MATVIIHTADQYLAGFLAELQTLSSYPELAISITPDAENGLNAKPVTNGQALPKLSHEALFTLPLAQRLHYFEAHGGVFAVMAENGFALTEADVEGWQQCQEQYEEYLNSLGVDGLTKLLEND